ncbi:hypothetical protein [Leisingera sp. JC11]|uniref:hypothetical protein n=1 Tax=Leisingera sp. JC11 TaxID=3042469 RepID=UPI0034571124
MAEIALSTLNDRLHRPEELLSQMQRIHTFRPTCMRTRLGYAAGRKSASGWKRAFAAYTSSVAMKPEVDFQLSSIPGLAQRGGPAIRLPLATPSFGGKQLSIQGRSAAPPGLSKRRPAVLLHSLSADFHAEFFYSL